MDAASISGINRTAKKKVLAQSGRLLVKIRAVNPPFPWAGTHRFSRMEWEKTADHLCCSILGFFLRFKSVEKR